MTIARRLAERIHAVDYDALPAAAVAWAKIGILDTVAVTLAGAPEACTRLTAQLPGIAEADGPSHLFAMGRRASVLDAALINGVASHALDFDDVNNQIGGHPSVPLVPALFAVADMTGGVGGRDAIAAYVAGFEAETQIGVGVHYHHYNKGWHPTATLGIFGTVCVTARLLGLGVDETAEALGLATSLASGVKANFGTMTKPLHIGHSLRNGVMAALLVRDGFTANAGAFEHKQGFLEVFNGAGTYDVDRVFDGWGAPWNVTDPGPSLKAYPCCGSTHGAIDCALEIRGQDGFDAAAVAAVEMLTDPKRLPHTDNPDPQSGLEAKFSVHYVVARALLDGAVRLGHFEDRAYDEAAVRALMAKVTTGAHPDMQDPDADTYGAEVTVVMNDGRRLRHRADGAVLRGPARPMSDAELSAKFDDCAARALPAETGRAVFERLSQLQAETDISEISALCAGKARSGLHAAE
ncbi:MAG: MmgE/PrpD family protein [Magnetovibrio sp.]|nr:MmgE/PrpD family protein [Magnetovibrio sp.]